MSQTAVKPVAETSRFTGRMSPLKLGCGQGEFRLTAVTPPTGVKEMPLLPLKTSSWEKSYCLTSGDSRHGNAKALLHGAKGLSAGFCGSSARFQTKEPTVRRALGQESPTTAKAR